MSSTPILGHYKMRGKCIGDEPLGNEIETFSIDGLVVVRITNRFGATQVVHLTHEMARALAHGMIVNAEQVANPNAVLTRLPLNGN